MEIKGPSQPPLPKLPVADGIDAGKSTTIKSDIESWKTGQILRAVVTETNPQQTRLNIQGVLAQTATPAKLQLEVGQELNVQLTAKHPLPDFRLLSLDKPLQQVVAEQLRTQLPRQQSLSHLLADIKSLDKNPQLQKLLPAEVVQQAKTVLTALPEASRLTTPSTIKQALKNSGLFTENQLAQLASGRQNTPAVLEHDTRVLLLRLVNLLRNSLTQTTAISPLPQSALSEQLSTFTRSTPQPQASVASRLLDIANAEQLKLELIKHIESSLARIHSLQLSSIKNEDSSLPLWSFELPVKNQDAVNLFDIRIQQEEQNKDNEAAQHRWSLALAFELEGLGPVHVRVSWFNQQITASFWVKQQETQLLFKEYIQLLQQRLNKAGLDVARLQVHQGEPEVNATTNWQRILDEKV